MNYTLYQLLWFYLLYSFIGWAIGTSVAAVREHRFIDVGFLFGPYCPAYGFGAVAFAVFLPELRNHLFFLFLGGVILSSVITFSTGFVLEKIFHRKWWDYSRKRFQFGGYVNLPYTVVWGISAVVCISFINPSLKELLVLIPSNLGTILLIVLYAVLCLDLAGTIMAIKAVHSRLRRLSIIEGVSENLQKAADMMGEGLTGWVQKHMAKAYPSLEAKELLAARQEKERQLEAAKERAGVFAVGCSFYKLVCLFFLGAFLGDITETIFCLATTGKLMSRSSVVYGPFSIVWGLGCAMLTWILYRYREQSDRRLFLCGTILGGAYEYICSVFTEIVFGTVFWDYSKIPFNLGGRINLLYCFFWGFAAIIWMKGIYPFLSRWIEKIPVRIGKPLCMIMVFFMSVNIALSGLALDRYSKRHDGLPAKNAVGELMDDWFPDPYMEKVYPNIKFR